MRRRDFIKLGSFGAASVLVGAQRAAAQTSGAPDIALTIEETFVELIDGSVVMMLLYRLEGAETRPVGPVIRAREGQRITVAVTNAATGPHGFAIPGAPEAEIPVIAPGATETKTFDAPRPGSYLYVDPVDAPVFRLLGLHGAFVVLPAPGLTPAGAESPYGQADQTDAVRALFDALGDAAPRPVVRRSALGEPKRFIGRGWDPTDPERERVWVFNEIDPRFNAMLERGEPIDPADMQRRFLPRYFTLNGLSGFDAAFDEQTVPKGYVGEPCLIRTMNAGLATHAPHIHGNHIFELTRSNGGGPLEVNDLIIERDTWIMPPLERRDVLLPFEQPSDIPDAAWPPFEEPFPLFYPMHCHVEMSQTAAGGDYPQGLVTDWEILGPFPPAPPPAPAAAVVAAPAAEPEKTRRQTKRGAGRGRR